MKEVTIRLIMKWIN